MTTDQIGDSSDQSGEPVLGGWGNQAGQHLASIILTSGRDREMSSFSRIQSISVLL